MMRQERNRQLLDPHYDDVRKPSPHDIKQKNLNILGKPKEVFKVVEKEITSPRLKKSKFSEKRGSNKSYIEVKDRKLAPTDFSKVSTLEVMNQGI